MHDDTLARLNKCLAEGPLRPLPSEPIEPSLLDRMVDDAYPTITEVAREDPAALRDLVVQPKYTVADSHGRYFDVREFLIRVLDELDTSGELLLDVACETAAEWYARVAAIDRIGRRGSPALLRRLLGILDELEVDGEVSSAVIAVLAQIDSPRLCPWFAVCPTNSVATVSFSHGVSSGTPRHCFRSSWRPLSAMPLGWNATTSSATGRWPKTHSEECRACSASCRSRMGLPLHRRGPC